ncbi:hypothetical protein KXX34_005375 [Aspergillus fumigatus]|nr:hypothetical protein KXX34_005375 [Aspergillus fumigatus]
MASPPPVSTATATATGSSHHFPNDSVLKYSHIGQTEKYVFSAFAGVVWYNAIELIVLCLTTFKRYRGCYFWSLLLASISLTTYILGFFFFFFLSMSVTPYVAVAFIVPSWCVMITGHSLVLWSRLHLVMQRPKVLRAILVMIIVNAITMQIPITVLLFGAVSAHPKVFTRGYNVMERIQLIVFAVQECIISSTYVYETIKMLRLRPPEARHRRMLLQLLVINIVILVLDVAVIGTQYAGYYPVQVMFKPVAYSIKFKLEYAILGRLIQIAKGEGLDREQVSSSVQGFQSCLSDQTATVGNGSLSSPRPPPDSPGTVSALSGIPVLVIYLALTRPTKCGESPSPRRPIATGLVIRPLAFRVVVTLLAVLGVEIALFGPPGTTIVGIILPGVAKSLMWHFLLQTAEHCSWSVTAAIGTFRIVATRNPFILTSNVQAFSHLIASSLALGQVISFLPDKAKCKSALWICIAVYLVPYLFNNYSIHVAKSSVTQSSTHPIDLLRQDAKANFQALLERQSTSYAAACEEYRRRYGMEPPPDFEGWYNFAKAHQSPIIDDFDVIYERVSPFWSISGVEVTETINRLQETLNSDVWVCTFSAAEARTSCSHPHRSVDRNIQGFLNAVLADLRGLLPDIRFLVNHLDEPRVLLPPSSERPGSLNMTNYSRRPVWDTVTKPCSSADRKKADRPKVQTFGLPFVTDHHSAIDLCRHPEYRDSHGLLISPTSFPLIEGLVPILATGSLSTMGDILYPNPAYLEPEFEYVAAKDGSWDSKHNNLYWAGSTTGAFAVKNDWQSFHRERFVKLAQNLGNGLHSYLREGKGVVNLVKSSFLNSRLFDVAFTRILQCETRYCRDQRALFRIRSWADRDEALRSRLVFDIDGNGISGRYYKLLAQSMTELPEMVMYFTSEAGQKCAQEIAEQGQDWFSKAIRKEDMTIYMYRVLLELARLQDPEGPANKS